MSGLKYYIFLKWISPNKIRFFFGILGISLPYILSLGIMDILSSISAYYYTKMQILFMLILILQGYMLMALKGHDDANDDKIALIAGIFAISTALFPTYNGTYPEWIGYIHYFSAAVFLGCLGVISMVFFRQSANNIYLKIFYFLCGLFTLLSLVVVIITVISGNNILGPDTVFYLETISINFFGLAWVFKSIQGLNLFSK